MRKDVKKDWIYSNKHLPEAFNILREQASFLVEFDIAPEEVDLQEVGDIVLSSNMGPVAFRVREPKYHYFRDFTIRSKRKSGVPTEIHKIREGKGRWYFYAWSDGNRGLKDWILVDIDQFRESGLAFAPKPHKPNPDGVTWFYAYSLHELFDANCLVATSYLRAGLSQTPPDHEEQPEPNNKREQLSLFDDSDYYEAHLNELQHHYYND